MKSVKVLLIAIVLSVSASIFANENGACVLLTMKYAEQYPVYTAAVAGYKSASSATPAYGTHLPPSMIEASKNTLNTEKAKLDKIKLALKNGECFTAEDEAAVNQQLK